MERTAADSATGTDAGGGALAGTGVLLRFALRRDRVRLPVWIGALTAGTLASLSSFEQTYSTDADRTAIAKTLGSPAGLAMSGPGHYLDDYGLGAMMGHQMLGFVAVLVGLMTVLTVARHTRTEEETGRAELVRAAVVGRHAHLTAALVTATLASLALGGLLAAGLGASGAEGVGWHGSLLYGAAHAAVGIAFAGVAAVTVQVTQHSRGASGMALAAIGAAYALRAAGDVGGGALSWLSPIGWAQRTYVFVDDRWWPLLLCLLLAAGAAAVGYVLSTRRDLGAGLRAARTGRGSASGLLTRPVGFALRQQRGLLYGFAAGLFVLGAMYGSILGQAEDMIEDLAELREVVRQVGDASLAESFAATVMIVVAVIASVHGVMAALRPRAEETAGRAEPLLATGLSRARWVGSHVAVATAGGVVVLLAAGLGFGLLGAASTGDAGVVPDLLGAALAYAPALWVTAGVGVALFGWAPRATAAVWIVPVYAFVVGYLGPILEIPDWLAELSPFGHVPRVPAEGMDWGAAAGLTAVAAALVAFGIAGFRRRDLETK
ncbi:ABC transporter permease [Streptomyces sp. DSM 42041]|uniref:ABC transporter permease n=1 Tax=Streptomyces hazeniae TaxID=3075538 RepID=A0ABU2NRV8_9ACTN|nr:ABC transporter permease [Streptomyces sp. DSM 42041]MDT0379719.1 ABC transporter permease [Streptomyces sp. DSM 42041]